MLRCDPSGQIINPEMENKTLVEDEKHRGIEIASHNSPVAGLITFPKCIAESNVEHYWFYSPSLNCCLEFPSIATGSEIFLLRSLQHRIPSVIPQHDKTLKEITTI
jgi:hypothetical protein